MPKEISLCMIVKDEERDIKRCLESVKDLVDEIILVDTGSKDKTVEIAKSYNAKIYYFKWCDDFAIARNESLKYATKDWILIMDADDEFCMDDRIKFKELKSNLDKKYIYYFETLSYLGYEKGFDISINMNPRLFKNRYGYYYRGAVHNQLLNSKNEALSKFESIRIYHYGYINKKMIDKNKRNRNMTILEKLIKKNPENKFNYFNLGNEYCCLNKKCEALRCYYKCYEDFKPYLGYSPKLIERIVEVNYEMRNFHKAIEFINVGLSYYPDFSDLYYLKGIICDELGEYLSAIESFKTCINIGSPPGFLKSIYGVEDFRSFDELSRIYIKLKDYDKAYMYSIESLKVKPDYLGPLINILNIFKEKGLSIDKIKLNIEKFFSDFPREYYFIADLFYKEGYYDTALEYIRKLDNTKLYYKEVCVLKSNIFARIGKFDACVRLNSIYQGKLVYLKLFTNNIISLVIMKKYKTALEELNKFNHKGLSESKSVKKCFRVYKEMVNIFMDKDVEDLSSDENDRQYTKFIIEIIEIFIINNKLQKSDRVLKLMDCIKDKYKFIEIGKLYFKYGYFDRAKDQIFKSVKMYNLIDKESVEILKKCICTNK